MNSVVFIFTYFFFCGSRFRSYTDRTVIRDFEYKKLRDRGPACGCATCQIVCDSKSAFDTVVLRGGGNGDGAVVAAVEGPAVSPRRPRGPLQVQLYNRLPPPPPFTTASTALSTCGRRRRLRSHRGSRDSKQTEREVTPHVDATGRRRRQSIRRGDGVVCERRRRK